MRYLKIAVIIIGMFVIAAVAGFQVFFRLPVPEYSGTIEIDGLASTVEVRTDRHGVPHIFADNEKDLFFAQGYITARERLFQMDVSRLAGRGELSTYFGELTVEKDRFLKTVGFYRRAGEGYRQMSPAARDIINAYTKGVNTYIKTVKSLPREYFFLGTKPGLWAPEDSVVIALLMSYSLTRSKKIDLILHQIGRRQGENLLRKIIPAYPDFAPTLTGKRGTASVDAFPEGLTARFPSKKINKYFHDFNILSNFSASNWIIFSGDLTTTGKPFFSGSPDLEPTLPALFYITHIKGGDFDVSGGALPGVPGIGPLGFNGRFAWSAVNGRGDELDYFIEKLNPKNPNQYLTEHGYKDFIKIEETIKIKGGEGVESEKLTVKISRHGPMISDVLPMAPENCAMQWVALERPDTDIEGLLNMNRARNFEEFRNALSLVKTMNLNLGYADTDGNIGWQFTASPPIRKKGDGSIPVPGWNGEFEWTGYVPFEQIPYDYNPEKGYTASFNNDPGNISYHLTNYYLFERAIRFHEIMKRRGNAKITLTDFKALQLDTVSVVAERWVPHILDAGQNRPELAPYLKLLKDWDFRMDIKSVPATIFSLFYYRLMENTLRDDVGTELWEKGLSKPYFYYVPDLVLTKIRSQNHNELFDDNGTKTVKESRDDIIIRSMNDAVAQLTAMRGRDTVAWKWGDVHQMEFKHPLGGKLFFLNLDPIPTRGSHHTINSGFWDPDEPFKMNSGGVIRMVIDFSNVENSTIISPPGQSGHYLSPYYDDLAVMWAEGRQIPLNYRSGKEQTPRLILTPKN